MDEPSPREARISELLRLRMVAQSGDDVLAYIAERLEQLYPAEYHEYRRRWHARSQEQRPGRLLDFVDWRALVMELGNQTLLAEILEEPLGEKARRIRQLLLDE